MKQNEIEIGNGAIVVHNPTDSECARIRGLFTKLFRRHAVITVTGVWGRWDLTKGGNPCPVLFVGNTYVEIDIGTRSAALGREAQHPIRVRLSEGSQVKLRFKMPED